MDAGPDAPQVNGRHARRSVAPAAPEEHAWRRYFERAARERPRFTVASDYLRQDFAATLQRLVPRDARVLEVGFGTGDTLAALPNAHRCGIDFTRDAVERARERHPGLDLRHGDALTYLSPERFDAIICDRLAQSVPDIQRLLENLAAHLERDGRIYLSCFNYLWEKLVSAAETLGFKLPTPPNNWLSEADLENLFALAGLEVVRFEDRLLCPVPVPLLDTVANRYVAKIPGAHLLTLYRLYILRRRATPVHRAPAVSVVVPARNEAGNIPIIVERTPAMGARTELIFVEGGSTDDTWRVLEETVRAYRGPLTLSLHRQTGDGKGDAVRAGFAQATGDLLMILDADLTVPPEELPKFYDAMTSGIGDYVQGTRLVYPMEDDAMRFLNKLGNIGFSKLFSFLLNQPIKDTLCGTKVLWAQDYRRLAANRSFFGDFDPFGDFDLIFGASKLNLKLVEIPIRYRNRTYGATNISRFRHGVLLLRMALVAARKLKFV